MKIVPTRRTNYGIRALISLAQRYPASQAAPSIGEDMEIPVGFLRQVLQELGRAGLVKSQLGRTGGYSLVRDPDTITLLDVIEALEGSVEDGQCAMTGGPCHAKPACALHGVWSSARRSFAEQLAAARLSMIAADHTRALEGAIPIADPHHAG